MVHRLPFITGAVMLVVAGTLAFVVTNGGEDNATATSGTDRSRKNTGEQFRDTVPSGIWKPESSGTGAFYPETSGKSGRRDRPRADMTGARERGQTPLRTDLKVQVKAGHPQHEELAANAGRVESFALRQLARLTDNLDLTPEQQGRIFPILVRGAQSYDPGMQIVDGRGSNGSSKPVSESTAAEVKPLDPQEQQELLQQELDMPQAEALVNFSERDLMIWEELINDLTNQLDQATPGQVAGVTPTPTPASTPAVEPEPEREMTGGTGTIPSTPAAETPATGGETTTPPESHGGRNLFDLLPEG